MRNESLAAVVDRLINRHVNNVTRDRSCENEVSKALLLEHLASVLGAVNGTINIDGHQVAVRVQRLLEERLRVACSCVGDENVDFAEVGDDFVDMRLHGLRVCDIDAVGFCTDGVLFCETLCTLLCLRVPGHVSTYSMLVRVQS